MIGPTPLLDFFKRGEVARDVRLEAAQGTLAPRAYEQLAILVLLLEDPDVEIRATADETLSRIPEEALKAFLARSDVPIGLREFFADRGVFPDEMPDLSIDVEADEPLIQPEEVDDETLFGAENEDRETAQQRLQKMSFTERLRAAVKGSREMRTILIRDTNKMIAAAGTEQPEARGARSGSVREDGERVRRCAADDLQQPRLDEELRHRTEPGEESEDAARDLAPHHVSAERSRPRAAVGRSQRAGAAAHRRPQESSGEAVGQGPRVNLETHARFAQRSTRSARRVFQRLGSPAPPSISKWTGPGCGFSSGQRPFSSRFFRHQIDRLGRCARRARRRPGAGSRAPTGCRSASAWGTKSGSTRRGAGLAIEGDDLSGRSRSEQAALEEIFLSAKASGGDIGHRSLRLLVFQQSFEHTDRRVERRALAARGVAVPAAVAQLLLKQSVDETIACLAEIGADRKHPSVDTGLDLAFEERRVAELLAPGAAVAHLADGPSHPIARRVHTEISQQLERVLGGDPGVRHERRAAPMAIRSLKVQQASAPTLRGHTRSLTRNARVGLADQVAHDLPADRRIRVEQPLEGVHQI